MHPTLPHRSLLLVIAGFTLIWLSACASTARSSRLQASPELSPTASPEPLQASSTPELHRVPVPTSTLQPAPTLESTQAHPSPTQELLAGEPFCQANWCAYPGHFWFIRPVSGVLGDSIDPSYRYATTQNGLRDPHSGVEFPARAGEVVRAAEAGRVVVAGSDLEIKYSRWYNFYGNLVILEHALPGMDLPVYTLYAHLHQIEVREGQEVAAGQEIGLVGGTGSATGPHLHFEVRLGDFLLESSRNPELWLQPHLEEDGTLRGALAGRIVGKDGQVRQLEIINIDRLGVNGQSARTYYLETYARGPFNGDDLWQETFALSDLTPGEYRISFVDQGRLHESLVTVFPGQVTVVKFEGD